MTQTRTEFTANLRHAAKHPEDWDVPGLLEEAADQFSDLLVQIDFLERDLRDLETTTQED